MFKKLFILTFSICLMSIMSLAEAQNFNYQPAPTTPQKRPATGLLPVTSPNDYRKAVSAASQQNKMTINNEVAQSLSKVPMVTPPPKPNPVSPSGSANISTSTPTSTPSSTPSPTTTTTVTMPPVRSETPRDNQTVQTAAPNSSTPTFPTTQSTTSRSTSPQSTTAPQFPNQQQSKVYTGFQPPPATGPASGPQMQPKSGWNIQY